MAKLTLAEFLECTKGTSGVYSASWNDSVVSAKADAFIASDYDIARDVRNKFVLRDGSIPDAFTTDIIRFGVSNLEFELLEEVPPILDARALDVLADTIPDVSKLAFLEGLGPKEQDYIVNQVKARKSQQ